MPTPNRLPADVELIRQTGEFHEHSVPEGLLLAHHLADGVWGRLVVSSGELEFVFEDDVDGSIVLRADDRWVIPPRRPHHLVLRGAVSFHIEFLR